jgi:hypothetical protein
MKYLFKPRWQQQQQQQQQQTESMPFVSCSWKHRSPWKTEFSFAIPLTRQLSFSVATFFCGQRCGNGAAVVLGVVAAAVAARCVSIAAVATI